MKDIEARAQRFGPATCGCVAVVKTWDAEHLTFAQEARIGSKGGWSRCPICKGSGVDPRIVESCAEAVKALELAEASCR